MAIHVALQHKTRYRYDRRVSLSPQIVRLRPAPHCRTPVLSYSLTIAPSEHFINWQQDPHGNYLARIVFPDKTRELSIDVDLVAEMSVINPFDFFLEPSADRFPFQYEPWLAKELAPFLEAQPAGPRLRAFLDTVDRRDAATSTFLVDLNRHLSSEIKYIIRLEPGVQATEETLSLGSGHSFQGEAGHVCGTQAPQSSLVEPEAFSDDRIFFHLAPPPGHRGQPASAFFFDDTQHRKLHHHPPMLTRPFDWTIRP